MNVKSSQTSQEKKIYSIGEVAQLVTMTQRTIRYYEEIGLLNSIKRLDGGKRIYTEDDLRRLKFINKLKVLGLSLNDMKDLEDLYIISKSNKVTLKRLVDILDRHLDEIENRTKTLKKLSQEISDYKIYVEKKQEEFKE
jgi:DNA-binding transcriptional MerR regulator